MQVFVKNKKTYAQVLRAFILKELYNHLKKIFFYDNKYRIIFCFFLYFNI